MAYTNIDFPAEYFNTKLYTGTGSSLAITGVGFQPDWVWIKSRSVSNDHVLFDVLRGVGNRLVTNTTGVETFSATSLTSFDTDGFTVGAGSARWNSSGTTYASWNWKANGAGVSNTSGTITSTVSANTTSGFSIVSYTGNGTAGATVGHGLGVAPKMIIVKNRSLAGTEWITYHASIGNGKYLALQSTAGQAGTVTIWGTSASTFTLAQAYGDYNGNGNSHVAYCFAEVKGFSKFGSYTGNNANDGPFVYTGFKPAFILLKPYDGAYNWTIIDNKRNTYNVTTLGLIPNTSSADTTGAGSTYNMDILSNGFKPRYSSVELNGSLTYIYMAFAESPFVSAKGIPTTAR